MKRKRDEKLGNKKKSRVIVKKDCLKKENGRKQNGSNS